MCYVCMLSTSNQHDEYWPYAALRADHTHEISTQNLYLYVIRLWVKKKWSELIKATIAYCNDRESIFHLILLHFMLPVHYLQSSLKLNNSFCTHSSLHTLPKYSSTSPCTLRQAVTHYISWLIIKNVNTQTLGWYLSGATNEHMSACSLLAGNCKATTHATRNTPHVQCSADTTPLLHTAPDFSGWLARLGGGNSTGSSRSARIPSTCRNMYKCRYTWILGQNSSNKKLNVI